MAQKIRCRWQEDKRLLVNPDGQAMPCCYLANIYYQSTEYTKVGAYDSLYEGHKAQMEHPLLKSYWEKRDELNVFNKDVSEIVNHEWFIKTLPESWDSDETVHIQCKRMCSIE